ncbi:capsid cement protein [Pseudomonas sp. TMP25]|uniref:capsid cement protein n=1 Tax=Pseudomonas sp. TMP25 TaxID=3136561 RepID=UPI00310178C1
MATNFVQDGNALQLVAPSGGVVSGGLYEFGALVVVAITSAAEGETFTGHPGGVWNVPAATGLTLGAKVSLKAGALVADGTASSTPCGKLVSATADGFAHLRLSN